MSKKNRNPEWTAAISYPELDRYVKRLRARKAGAGPELLLHYVVTHCAREQCETLDHYELRAMVASSRSTTDRHIRTLVDIGALRGDGQRYQAVVAKPYVDFFLKNRRKMNQSQNAPQKPANESKQEITHCSPSEKAPILKERVFKKSLSPDTSGQKPSKSEDAWIDARIRDMGITDKPPQQRVNLFRAAGGDMEVLRMALDRTLERRLTVRVRAPIGLWYSTAKAILAERQLLAVAVPVTAERRFSATPDRTMPAPKPRLSAPPQASVPLEEIFTCQCPPGISRYIDEL